MQETVVIYPTEELNPNTFPFGEVQGNEAIQGSAAWLEFRKGKIGSSQAASIVNKNPYETPLMCYEAIINETRKNVTSAMQRGKDEEPKALRWFNEYTGKKFSPAVLQSEEFPFLIASLDGFLIEDGKVSGCEIKTPGLNNHLSAIEGEVPQNYLWQMYHQMMISGADTWSYVSWTGKDGIVIEVQRDEFAIASLLEAELNFCKTLGKRIPPEPIDKDWVHCDDLEIMGMEYSRLKKSMDSLSEKSNKLKKEIVEMAQRIHPRIKLGETLRVQKVFTRGRVDYDLIPELIGVDRDVYRKEGTTSWRLD